jgi:hypothetical protein
MKLRQLFESQQADAAFCFGRFNPPHQGHAEVWKAVKHAGHSWFIGTNPTTAGADDPLSFQTKIAWMAAIDPEIEGHILGEKSIMTLAAKIFSHLGEGKTIAYVTDATDWQWAGKLLHQYNGQKSMHGYYNFKNIIHVQSPRVMSATKLREAARAGNEQLFYQLAGVDPNLRVHGKTFFETVAEACGQHPVKVKKAKKEKAVAETPSKAIGHTAKSLENPPKVMQHRAKRDQEREKQWMGTQIAKNNDFKKDEWGNYKESVKYANRMIREMRAKEFLKEGDIPADGKKFDKSEMAAVRGALSMPGISINKSNGNPYAGYRFGIALAGSHSDEGHEHHQTTPPAGPMAGDPLLAVFADEEYDIIKNAAKMVMAGPIRKLADMKSRELPDTNKQSIVAKPKKNKYGI